jgi:hypothetical protein
MTNPQIPEKWSITNQKEDTYTLKSVQWEEETTKQKLYLWCIFDSKGNLIVTDRNQIDGTPGFQSVSHAFNDAVKNLTSLASTNSI